MISHTLGSSNLNPCQLEISSWKKNGELERFVGV
jgi:hypothetical protein